MQRTGQSLFLLCSGLGLGNASRVVAILQALRAQRSEVRVCVFSWGKALPFFRDHCAELDFEVIELWPYRLRAGGWPAFFLGFPAFVLTYIRNSRRLWRELRKRGPRLALLDSDYHFLPFLACRVPVVSLGQASDVVRRAEKLGGTARAFGFRTWLSLVLFEKLDAWVQRRFSRIVLVPTFDPREPLEGNRIAIPLIVRREFLEGAPADPSQELCIVLSGSGIGSAPLIEFARAHGIPIFGSAGERIDPVVREGNPCIDRFSGVITQGGLSSISECLARRRPLFVFPIRDHAEQKLNAIQVQSQGLGEEIGEGDLDLEKIRVKLKGLTRSLPSPDCKGSDVSARVLAGLLEPSG